MTRLIMRAIFMLFAWLFSIVGPPARVWTVIGIDPKGDGRDASLADAAQLSYRYDRQRDMLWFRVTLYGTPNEGDFGVAIAADTGADASARTNWSGGNAGFTFDKLITVKVRRADGRDDSTAGVADAAGANSGDLTNLHRNNLQVRVEGDSILIGLPRTDLTDKRSISVIASVGSSDTWNDDIPNVRSAAIDLSETSSPRALREIDLDRNNFRFEAAYRTLSDGDRIRVVRKGSGRTPVILIPGVYSGARVFDGFLERNSSKYVCYLVTPAGLNGTPARSLPPETTSYGELTWTRRLVRDLLEVIEQYKLARPIVVAHGFPGSLAAETLAATNPVAVGGLIELASMPVQFFPSMKDPGRQATPAERIEAVDEAWARKWFKYVTPETWVSNNYPAAMYANDSRRAEEARQQVEAAPLPVKIRYLTEFMAADHSSELANFKVPMLALRPGFNQALLAEPANRWFKQSFQDAWEPFSKNRNIQLLTIPDARALMLDDQPGLVDQAMATFVAAIARRE